jgi:hypothetical protein
MDFPTAGQSFSSGASASMINNPQRPALIADCHYRIACIGDEKRQWKRSTAEFEKYLAMRRIGYGSIYSLREVKAQYAEVRAKVRR